MKLRATYLPQVHKTGTTGGEGLVDGEPKTVMIIQITQFEEGAASVIFTDSNGNIGEDNLYRFSQVEGW